MEIADARDLTLYHNQYDVAISVNSILLPKMIDTEKMFLETYNVLKKEGILLGTFPAMESFLYLALLLQEKAIKKEFSEEEAIKMAEEELLKIGKLHFLSGHMEYKDCKQKHYYLFELKYRLLRAGFTKIKIKKVYYPWEMYENKQLMEFKDKEKMWDWFVFAKK